MEIPLKEILHNVMMDPIPYEEELFEIKLLYDSRFNMGIGVYPDKGRVGAYFKVFNGPDPGRSSLLARIAFKHPYYEHHYENSSQVPKGKHDVKGKQSNWYLNTKERQRLIEILERDYKNNHQINNCKALILDFNKASQVRQQSKSVDEADLFIHPEFVRPNYMNLPSSREENDRVKAEYEAADRRLRARR